MELLGVSRPEHSSDCPQQNQFPGPCLDPGHWPPAGPAPMEALVELSWQVLFRFGRRWARMIHFCACTSPTPAVQWHWHFRRGLKLTSGCPCPEHPLASVWHRRSFGQALGDVAPSPQGLAAGGGGGFCPAGGSSPYSSKCHHTGQTLVLQPSREQTGPSVTCWGKPPLVACRDTSPCQIPS